MTRGIAARPDLPAAAARLARELEGGRGLRVGETAVVSTLVHVLEPRRPALVRLLLDADAGRVFYGRNKPGEIVHLDVFHQVAEADHRRLAAAIRAETARYFETIGASGGAAAPRTAAGGALAATDWIDVQTGTGGGRVSGSLTFGRKASLRDAHRNHVHVTVLRQVVTPDLLLLLVAAVEAELTRQGVGLRRVEALEHAAGGGQAPIDLSPYTDESDSRLREDNRRSSGVGSPQLSLTGDEADQLADIIDDVGGLEGLREVLDRLVGEEAVGMHGGAGSGGAGSGGAPMHRSSDLDALRRLEQRGWTRTDRQRYVLTEKGQVLRHLLKDHLREVEAQLKTIFRRIPARLKGPGRWRGIHQPRKVGRGPIRHVRPAEPRSWVKELAVAETVVAAARRKLAGGQERLSFSREDLHQVERSQMEPLDICLLIDASASMAGRRLKAAKFLARHLLLATRDQVSVIAFQEGEVKVHVPFTRNYRRVEEGLRQIRPFGLTPLAHGLTEGCDFIRASHSRNPLLLLITDGIPTVPKWTVNPIEDALTAAARLAREKIRFGCIGLLPSRSYLENLARVGGGTLYVLDELDRDALVRIAHTERTKLLTSS